MLHTGVCTRKIEIGKAELSELNRSWNVFFIKNVANNEAGK